MKRKLLELQELLRGANLGSELEMLSASVLLDELIEETDAARSVYIIVGRDRGDGLYRLSTGGVHAYARRVVAQEDLDRYLFKTGQVILEMPVVDQPTILPHSDEQRLAWEEKEKK